MKVMFVLRSVANYGGVERVVVDKMNYLAEHGHHVTLLTYEQGHHPNAFQLNEHVRYVDLDCPYYTIFRYNALIRQIKRLQMTFRFKKRFHQLVKRQQPDVIVGVTNATDFIHQILSAPYGKKVVESHGAFPAIMKGKTWKTKIKTNIVLRTIRKCDLLITLTKADSDCWKPYVKRIRNVPNPVSFYIDKPDTSLKKEGSIIYVGRLSFEKRIDRLIEAFSLISSRFPSWYIDIYGAGEKKAEINQLINKYSLNERIHILEPTRYICDEYQKSQFLVLCSDYEGFGLVVVEAMSSGIPVVSTDCTYGPSEIIDDGVTGLLAKLDARDLSAKIEWMITHEPEREEMGIKAHQAAAKYRKEVVMKQWENAYLSVL